MFDRMMTKKLAQSLLQEQAAFATLLANRNDNGYKCVLFSTATPTLTQSRLLAVLLEHQHYKAIQLVWRHARRERMRAAFWRTVASLFHARALRTSTRHPAKPLIGTVPRHT
jgi:hypothetical protein